jgi:hypothetical protein
MVSPRRDRWVVSAEKPEDDERFDSLVEQPFGSFRKTLGYGSGRSRIYELFQTEEEARRYAVQIQLFGAKDISVSPPRTSIKGSRRLRG